MTNDVGATRRGAIGGGFVVILAAVSAYVGGGAMEAFWTVVAGLIGIGLALGVMHVARR